VDKPDLLKSIQLNHPEISLEYIQALAREESARQTREAIIGMLHKKPLRTLEEILKYKEEIYATKERKIEENNKQEHSNRSEVARIEREKSREGKINSSSYSIRHSPEV
jgi:hypothetical protein